MDDIEKNTRRIFRQPHYIATMALAWSALVAASLIWSTCQYRKATHDVARSQARAGFDRDVLFRRWNAMHGGVYVPVTKDTPPNPHLDVPERDITTPSGRRLTLMNPAYMTRQVHELGKATSGVHGHITSLKPIRPENRPDAWEKTALEALERGAEEYSSIEVFRGEPHLRMMRPLHADKECLRCHAQQGYQEGQIRGGISSSVPMAPFSAIGQATIVSSIARHGAFWALGLAAIVYFHRRLNQYTRKLASNEKRVQESEQRFMDVLHASDDAILLLDGRTFIDCNEATARMLGYPCRDDFLMTHPSQLSPPRQPDGRDSFEKAEELLQTASEKGCQRFEWVHRKASGEVFPTEVTLTPITYHGKTILHCLWRDLTAEKQAKAERDRLRLITEKILESMPVGVVIIGRDKTVRHANSTALTMMGYESRQEILGRECHHSFCPAQKNACPILDFGTRLDNAERILITKEKKKIPILKTVIPVTINDEEVLLETFVDISDRKRSEEALKAAKNEAEAANRTKGQFLASMSHELRTPLTAILGFTDLLLGANDDEEQRKEYLVTIRASGQHLLELINDILDLSKIEADRLEVERSLCAPHEILNEVVRIMRAQAQAKNLELGYRWSSPVPGFITTDGARLRQILLNLVGNAVKFTRQGRVEIVARTERFPDGNRLLVDVIDTGIGISPDKLQTIFEPFVQSDNSVTREFGGTGLGLAISDRLARALGGELKVESTVGVGSKFTMSVAAGDLEGVAMLPSMQSEGMPTGQDGRLSHSSARLHAGRLLLVEDGHVNRRLISTVLEKAGFTVATAENGKIGMELAATTDFDLILMDMQMPVLDGYGATRKLRDLGCPLPIIALTAHAMKSDREKCLAAGCSHYLSKPIEIDTLLATVDEALGNSTARAGRTLPRNLLSPLVSSLPTEEPVFREIVEEFAAYFRHLLTDMRQALAQEDVRRLAELAHNLKGSAGTAGFAALTGPARQLESLVAQLRLDGVAMAIDELAGLAERIMLPPSDIHAPS